VAITGDGHRAIISSPYSSALFISDLERGELLDILLGHRDTIKSIAVTPDGHCAVSGSEDRTLRLWELGVGQREGDRPRSGLRAALAKFVSAVGQVLTPRGDRYAVAVLAVTADGKWAVSSSLEGEDLLVWNVASGQSIRALDYGSVSGALVPLEGSRVMSVATGGRASRVWDLKSGQIVRTLKIPSPGNKLIDAIKTRDGFQALLLSDDGTLRLWDLNSGQTIRRVRQEKAQNNSQKSQRKIVIWEAILAFLNASNGRTRVLIESTSSQQSVVGLR
jgi:WD40 repeat protein